LPTKEIDEMKRILVALGLLALPFAAQEQKKEEGAAGRPAQKIFILKYADPMQLAGLLRVFNASITPNGEMHALAVAGSPETMKAVEEAIQRLDIPSATPRDVELAFYLIVGGEDGPGGAMPKELEPVVAQLRNAFAFKNYRLLDTLTLRTRAGQHATLNSAGGSLQGEPRVRPVQTWIDLGAATIAPDGGIRLERMEALMRIEPGTPATTNLRITANLDVKDGQKVVVGRVGMSPNQAMFLVVTAHPVAP
jgi:hypothetical protein